jgi:hypothetical protein
MGVSAVTKRLLGSVDSVALSRHLVFVPPGIQGIRAATWQLLGSAGH